MLVHSKCAALAGLNQLLGGTDSKETSSLVTFLQSMLHIHSLSVPVLVGHDCSNARVLECICMISFNNLCILFIGKVVHSRYASAAAGEELDPKGTTPGSASSKKAKQHPHKHAATAPVGEELDPSANKDASSPRHAKRSKGGGGPADAIAPTSSGLNRSSTQEQGTQHQQQQQQHSSPSGSDQSSGSGSGPEAQPASAHPQPSWRQQEQLEPEEEAPRAAAPLPRALSRPFSRSGSQTHTSAQAAEQDPSARFRPHHHHPSRDSHEAQPRQSALSRGLPHEPSPRHANADGVFSAADHRDRGPGHAAASRGPDRADRHSPGPERARRDRSEGGYPHYNGPQSHMDRRRPQHPQVTGLCW